MSFVVEIASVSDREGLVAEIWQDDEMVAEMQHHHQEIFKLEIYPRESGIPWRFNLQDWVDVLEKAQQSLCK